ncbi:MULTISPECIES: ATP-binding cassette domain-containing protein [unclassified Streptococcus]|uniref:ABC transporter ATP-binding protein n=1 Tax=unclassified Streptococcus TaxID=2608887 RepID=UPI000A8F3497|nr:MULTISPECIES: ATP-binding cassette domain-containing protein [unclassified Streptococcus]
MFSLFFIYSIEKKLIYFIVAGYVVVMLTSHLLLKVLYHFKEQILVNQEIFQKKLVRGFMELVTFRMNKIFPSELQVLKCSQSEIIQAKIQMTLIHELFFTIFALLVHLLKIILLVYAMQHSDLTVGGLVTMMSLLEKTYELIAIFNVIYVDYRLQQMAVSRYLRFLHLKDDEQLTKGVKKLDLKGNILVEQLDFSYPNRPSLFEGLNLTISAGKSLALVGASGSGKTTLVKLLLGLLKYSIGHIQINGQELKNMQLEAYYEQIAYLPQEAAIFDGTLRENLIFGREYEDGDILSALEKACLKEFYDSLKDGLDTELGEKGVSLSGGERQRLALARLFLTQPEIIVLDESTSALDNITARKVMNNLLKAVQGKTLMMIAHRLESIKGADEIIVFKDGKIVETEKFNELLEKQSEFYRLYYQDLSGR